jgi:cytoplasmic iron level regulating protein YaaA (DUF328/UPF0246 family)
VLILLPPSEGKTAASRGKSLELAGLSFPELTGARTQVLEALVELSGTPDAASVLGVPATQPELLERNQQLLTAPTARADRVYSGVLYDALGLADLSPAAKRRASSRLAITSALFGLVRPGDRIPAYRLSGDAKLPGLPHLGHVAGLWRAHLGPVITDAVGRGLLVDLRSTSYAAFWRPEGLRTATVRVLHEVAGKRQVVSHFNKATKGRLVRALLEDGADPRTPQALAAAWERLGWTVELDTDPSGAGRLDVVVSEV